MMINFKEFCLLESTLSDSDVIELGKRIRDTYKTNNGEVNYKLLSTFISSLNIGNRSPSGLKKNMKV